MQADIEELAETTKRISPGAMDDAFCDYYLNTGGDRPESYRLACKAVDKECNNKYVAQYSKAMFDRLKHRISDMLDQAEIEDATLARNTLRMILQKEDASDQAKIAAAKELARKRVDKIEIKQVDDISTIEAEIISIERALKANAIEGDVVEDEQHSSE
jgi:hypothetical protein